MARVARTPYVATTVDVPSPDDSAVIFKIKKVGNRDVILYRDRDAVTRYLARDGANDDGVEYITEKEYPRGSNQLDTIQICLADWNLSDPTGIPIPVDRETILEYLSTEELDFLFDKCFEINPILLNQGVRRKSAEEPATTTDRSASGGSDTSAVHSDVSAGPDPVPEPV